jgi:hypothetical protein
VATRVFSTDPDGKFVLVTKEHVEYAALLFDRCYRSQAMSYFEYARRYKQTNDFTAERSALVRKTLMATPNWEHTVAVMLTFDYMTRRQLSDALNFEKGDFDKLWSVLMSMPLIENKPRGYRKTVAFTKLLKKLGSSKTGYDAALSEDFEHAVNETAPPDVSSPALPLAHWSETDKDGPDGEDPPF